MMPRFPNVSCSQCGRDFGPGEHGFSECENHAHLQERFPTRSAPLTLQQHIDARLAGLETALSIKLRKATRVRFELKRDGERTLAWVYYFGPVYDIHTLSRGATIDEALDAGMAAILAMRSYEDELADLGLLVPERERAA